MAKYKVGDKVRVRSDLKTDAMYGFQSFTAYMAEHLGKTVTISECNTDSYRIEECGFNWTDEMFEGLAEEEHHMSAEEVLEWLKDNYENGNYTKCFGNDYTMANLLSVGLFDSKYSNLSTSEIVSKIEEYERNKQKEEKKIETEFRYVFRIIKDTKDKKVCVEEKMVNCSMLINETVDDMASEYLKEYCKNHKGNFFCTVERNYYVKENK